MIDSMSDARFFASATYLRCEWLVDPIGLGNRRPRFSWLMADDRAGARQTAYRVRVGTQPGLADVWDSQKQFSDQTVGIKYNGQPLAAHQRLYWQVMLWDHTGEPSAWSEPAFFQMGMLNQPFRAKWLRHPRAIHPRNGPIGYYRREFHLDGHVTRATLYATARGVYIAQMNGSRIGNDRLTPGWTNYRERIPYQAYDVTRHLVDGANGLGLILADGWFCGEMTHQCVRIHEEPPAVLAELRIEYTDGRVETIATDGTWRVSSDGPLVDSSFLHGDTIDARLAMPGWDSAGYSADHWLKVEEQERDEVELVAQVGPTVKLTGELPVVDYWQLPNGNWVFDLGQNMGGVVRLRAAGTPGQVLIVRHAETLEAPDSRVPYYDNLRHARATDRFTLAGTGGEEVFEPLFTFHGFRYVEVSGLTGPVSAETITGLVYHSDTPATGTFACSDKRLNQLQSNIAWGQRGNFVEVPTDCPQRDERLGWTGDAQVFIRTAVFNMDVVGFFERWLSELRAAQREDGYYPELIPDMDDSNKTASPAWADAAVIIPWTLYTVYGDRTILEDSYASMARYIECLVNRSRPRGFIYPDLGYGDWLSIGSDTPRELIGTAYSAHVTDLMRRIALILDKPEDAARYAKIFDQFKSAYNRVFVTATGRVVGASQTADLLSLRFNLLDDRHRDAVIDHLCGDIQRRAVLTTGFVGVSHLLPTLTLIGRDDLAWKLLTTEQFPSWLFCVKHGATTIWERWDGWTPNRGFQDPAMNSFNHYAYGSCGEWMYERLGGICADPDRPGFGHVIISPYAPQALAWCRTSLRTVRGRVAVHWAYEDSQLVLDIVVPANMSATVTMPLSQAVHELKAGQHRFVDSLPGAVKEDADPAVMAAV